VGVGRRALATTDEALSGLTSVFDQMVEPDNECWTNEKWAAEPAFGEKTDNSPAMNDVRDPECLTADIG
jgi:hypothetical protein